MGSSRLALAMTSNDSRVKSTCSVIPNRKTGVGPNPDEVILQHRLVERWICVSSVLVACCLVGEHEGNPRCLPVSDHGSMLEDLCLQMCSFWQTNGCRAFRFSKISCIWEGQLAVLFFQPRRGGIFQRRRCDHGTVPRYGDTVC